MADYYTFHKFAVKARGRDLVIVGKPGAWSGDRLNPGTAALLEVAEIEQGDAVLDLGCGTGILGAVAGLEAPEGRVTLVDCNVVAVACAERTLAANGVTHGVVRLADGVAGLPSASFDLVLSHLPRGRAVQEELIRGAAWVLRPGGRFYFVASKRAGVKGAVAYARELFGHCGVIRQKQGYHVGLAVRPDRLPPPSQARTGYVTRVLLCDGIPTKLVSKPGLFAWDRLDEGTAALVRAMEIAPRDQVLDLGCGTGLAGLAAARRATDGQAVLVDADVRAVEAAWRTATANGVVNVEVSPSDCASAVLDRRFDVVVSNPPFHQGVGTDYEVAHQFVRDAARVLRRGGRLFLVANRHLRYADLIRANFGNVDAVYADNRYQVLTTVAQKPALR